MTAAAWFSVIQMQPHQELAMTAVTFDTLKFAKKLEAAGLPTPRPRPLPTPSARRPASNW